MKADDLNRRVYSIYESKWYCQDIEKYNQLFSFLLTIQHLEVVKHKSCSFMLIECSKYIGSILKLFMEIAIGFIEHLYILQNTSKIL